MTVCLIGYCMNSLVRERIRWGWRKPPGDVAVWNTLLIEELSKRPDVDLHVIAPAVHMRHMTQEFVIGRVHYHYFKPDVPFLHINWKHIGRLDQRTNYWWTRRIVQGWVRKINPDIVNLTGAENPHYSASILGLKGFPIYVSMQGVYSNPIRFETETRDAWREKFERRVYRENRYFGLNAEFMKDLILRDVTESPYFFWTRPLNIELDLKRFCKIEKKYDFVYFSRMNANKGALDIVKATAILRASRDNLRVCMIGRGLFGFEQELSALIERLNLRTNIIRIESFVHHDDLMCEVAKARCHVLPTYIDTIPCTIFEGIRLGLPFVGYKTGDIPKLNIGRERVLLSDPGDVQGLAKNMQRILDDELSADRLVTDSLNFIDRYFSNSANVEQLVSCYRAVIENFRKGTPIPAKLLYDNYLKSVKEK